MKVKINTGIVGADFAFSPGDIVDDAQLSAKVGDCWRSLCEPVDAPKIERAVRPSGRERRGGR